MKGAWKRISLLVLCLVVIAGVYFGCLIGGAWRAWRAEGEIAHTFFPVVQAIYRYAEATGAPPRALSDLLPEYLAALPVSDRAASLAYHALPAGQWRLDVHATDRRVWCWRSSRDAPRKDNAKPVGWIHGWEIVEPTNQRTNDHN